MMRRIIPVVCGLALLAGCDSGSKDFTHEATVARLYLAEHPGADVRAVRCEGPERNAHCSFRVGDRHCSAAFTFRGGALHEGAYLCDSQRWAGPPVYRKSSTRSRRRSGTSSGRK